MNMINSCNYVEMHNIENSNNPQILNNCTADSSICVFYRNVNNYVAFFAWLFYFIHSKNLVLCRKKGYIDYL